MHTLRSSTARSGWFTYVAIAPFPVPLRSTVVRCYGSRLLHGSPPLLPRTHALPFCSYYATATLLPVGLHTHAHLYLPPRCTTVTVVHTHGLPPHTGSRLVPVQFFTLPVRTAHLPVTPRTAHTTHCLLRLHHRFVQLVYVTLVPVQHPVVVTHTVTFTVTVTFSHTLPVAAPHTHRGCTVAFAARITLPVTHYGYVWFCGWFLRTLRLRLPGYGSQVGSRVTAVCTLPFTYVHVPHTRLPHAVLPRGYVTAAVVTGLVTRTVTRSTTLPHTHIPDYVPHGLVTVYGSRSAPVTPRLLPQLPVYRFLPTCRLPHVYCHAVWLLLPLVVLPTRFWLQFTFCRLRGLLRRSRWLLRFIRSYTHGSAYTRFAFWLVPYGSHALPTPVHGCGLRLPVTTFGWLLFQLRYHTHTRSRFTHALLHTTHHYTRLPVTTVRLRLRLPTTYIYALRTRGSYRDFTHTVVTLRTHTRGYRLVLVTVYLRLHAVATRTVTDFTAFACRSVWLRLRLHTRSFTLLRIHLLVTFLPPVGWLVHVYRLRVGFYGYTRVHAPATATVLLRYTTVRTYRYLRFARVRTTHTHTWFCHGSTVTTPRFCGWVLLRLQLHGCPVTPPVHALPLDYRLRLFTHAVAVACVYSVWLVRAVGSVTFTGSRFGSWFTTFGYLCGYRCILFILHALHLHTAFVTFGCARTPFCYTHTVARVGILPATGSFGSFAGSTVRLPVVCVQLRTLPLPLPHTALRCPVLYGFVPLHVGSIRSRLRFGCTRLHVCAHVWIRLFTFHVLRGYHVPFLRLHLPLPRMPPLRCTFPFWLHTVGSRCGYTRWIATPHVCRTHAFTLPFAGYGYAVAVTFTRLYRTLPVAVTHTFTFALRFCTVALLHGCTRFTFTRTFCPFDSLRLRAFAVARVQVTFLVAVWLVAHTTRGYVLPVTHGSRTGFTCSSGSGSGSRFPYLLPPHLLHTHSWFPPHRLRFLPVGLHLPFATGYGCRFVPLHTRVGLPFIAVLTTHTRWILSRFLHGCGWFLPRLPATTLPVYTVYGSYATLRTVGHTTAAFTAGCVLPRLHTLHTQFTVYRGSFGSRYTFVLPRVPTHCVVTTRSLRGWIHTFHHRSAVTTTTTRAVYAFGCTLILRLRLYVWFFVLPYRTAHGCSTLRVTTRRLRLLPFTCHAPRVRLYAVTYYVLHVTHVATFFTRLLRCRTWFCRYTVIPFTFALPRLVYLLVLYAVRFSYSPLGSHSYTHPTVMPLTLLPVLYTCGWLLPFALHTRRLRSRLYAVTLLPPFAHCARTVTALHCAVADFGSAYLLRLLRYRPTCAAVPPGSGSATVTAYRLPTFYRLVDSGCCRIALRGYVLAGCLHITRSTRLHWFVTTCRVGSWLRLVTVLTVTAAPVTVLRVPVTHPFTLRRGSAAHHTYRSTLVRFYAHAAHGYCLVTIHRVLRSSLPGYRAVAVPVTGCGYLHYGWLPTWFGWLIHVTVTIHHGYVGYLPFAVGLFRLPLPVVPDYLPHLFYRSLHRLLPVYIVTLPPCRWLHYLVQFTRVATFAHLPHRGYTVTARVHAVPFCRVFTVYLYTRCHAAVLRCGLLRSFTAAHGCRCGYSSLRCYAAPRGSGCCMQFTGSTTHTPHTRFCRLDTFTRTGFYYIAVTVAHVTGSLI